jgi:hypothetical protein
MRILFVGERRSPRAIQMGVTWKDRRLAGKQLFDAFDTLGVDSSKFEFTNVFETEDFFDHLEIATEKNIPIIGMGQKVQRVLRNMDIEHIPMVHPAARGSIRKKERYAEHVNGVLSQISKNMGDR